MTVFEAIYRENAWNGVESRSGPGSGPAATARLVPELLGLVAELDIRSVLDVGCGDGFWMPDLPGYFGFEPTREAVKLARRNHPGRRYGSVLPSKPFDLVIVRDVIQHLSLRGGIDLLAAIHATRSRWLLASTYVGGENFDIVAGDCYWPDLEADPFLMGTPERRIFDGYGYADPDEIRDPRKHLGLWRF
jgi:SAM-dependent methyltransferase